MIKYFISVKSKFVVKEEDFVKISFWLVCFISIATAAASVFLLLLFDSFRILCKFSLSDVISLNLCLYVHAIRNREETYISFQNKKEEEKKVSVLNNAFNIESTKYRVKRVKER